MKALIQRVAMAQVDVAGQMVAKIAHGVLVLLGVTHSDTLSDAERLAGKTARLRIFEDASGKTNRSLADVGGSVIVVSQFTLYADTAHGNRPGFSAAARADQARPIYEHFIAALRAQIGEERVATGVFGAEMQVTLVNDGPFTVEVCEPPLTPVSSH